MKASPKTKIVGLIAGMACCLLSFSDTIAQSYISFETFYHELAPYGNWINTPEYGQVWIPNVARGFQPYQTRGHWVMTEYGNTWVSDYVWGWAPFHYGRWYLDNHYGWMWVPGSEWGPAWVAWRSGGRYYGWAPLPPGLNVNVSINIGRRIPRYYWTFAQQRYITSPRIYDYCVPRHRVVNIINHTTVINNTYVYDDRHRYYSGPQRRDIERVTHRQVPVRRLQHSRQPGASSVRGGSVAMYRPTVRSRQGTSQSSAPASSRSIRDADRNNSSTRSSYDRIQPANPAVRSSRTRDNTMRSIHDNRSDGTYEPARSYQQRTPQNRTPTTSRSDQARQRSSSGSRYESQRVPNRSQQRMRSSSGRSSTSSRSAPRQQSQPRMRSSRSSSSPSRSVSPSRTPSSSRSSSPSVSRPSEVRSSPSETRSHSSASSSSSGRSRSSSTQSGRSRSSRPQR